MMKKQKRNNEDNRGVAIYTRKSRITNKGDSIGVHSSNAPNMPKESFNLMTITALWSMRIKG